MAKLLMEKQPGRLRPVDQEGIEALGKLTDGRIVTVEFKQARNPRQHRLFFALVGLLYEHQSRYATSKQLADALKIAVGWYDDFTTYDGRTVPMPRSISYASMPQEEFKQFFDNVIRLVVEKIMPHLKEGELRAELESMVGGR